MKVTYQSCDGARKTRTFKTLAGARKFAQDWIGKNPEMGSRYAISGDGIGKITAEGVELRALFGDLPAPPVEDPPEPIDDGSCDPLYGERMDSADLGESPRRCTCSAEQLNLVGCDCGFSDPLYDGGIEP